MDPQQADSRAGNLSPFLPTLPAKAGSQHSSPNFPRPLSAVWAKEPWVGTASSRNTGGCPQGRHDKQQQQLATAARPRQALLPSLLPLASCQLQRQPPSSLTSSTGNDRPQPAPMKAARRPYRCAQLQSAGVGEEQYPLKADLPPKCSEEGETLGSQAFSLCNSPLKPHSTLPRVSLASTGASTHWPKAVGPWATSFHALGLRVPSHKGTMRGGMV